MAESSRGNRSHAITRTLAAVGAGTVLLFGSRLLMDFFGPRLRYTMREGEDFALDSEEFVRFLSIVSSGTVRRSRITRLRNGEEFYPAELAAIRAAKRSINVEFYEFKEGGVSREMLSAMAERAQAGVEVRLIVDWLGSFSTHLPYFDRLKAAGGKMYWYHPPTWTQWQMANNRTHRKLITIDGEMGFIGGAGVADHWLHPTPDGPAWRDSVFKVEGEAIAGLISTFAENWLECSGEILSGPAQFCSPGASDGATCFVVEGTPHEGRTRTRILFQALLKSARKTIRITSPYFLPDRVARQALIEAVQKRGVKVQILTAGPYIDHPMVRRVSRRSSLHLVQAGAEIFEYQPSMIHAKLLTIDEKWSVVGSTNFDHRSFALNDEVNLAALDPELARVIDSDFLDDLKKSHRLTLAMLKERSLLAEAESVVAPALKWES